MFILFDHLGPKSSHYKMESMGHMKMNTSTKFQTRCFMTDDGLGDWHIVPKADGLGSLQDFVEGTTTAEHRFVVL